MKGTDHILVRVLGPLQLDRRGAEEPLRDRALRAVLSTLLVEAGRPVPAEVLVQAAWPGPEAPSRPLDALDTRISRLRTLLAPQADLTWTSGGCVLHLPAERIDAVWFERMVEAARWCPASEAISTLDRALALWRGEALPDLRRAGSAHPEAVRLRQLRARAVEDLAARELEVGALEDAAGRLLALLSAEPLRERACGYAMWALHHLGMTDDALACYEQLRERLSDDLGERTSLELDETYEAITGRRPTTPRGCGPAEARTTFVGRGHELARVSAMLDRERVVTVTGPGGAGKTRLVLRALSTITVPTTVVGLSGRHAADLPAAVAAALGLHTPDTDETVPAAVAEYLARGRHVLVLDSCEHLLTEVRTLVRRLLGRCPELAVLITSRVRLGLGGERVLPLGPLARDGTRDPLTSKAGRLFLDRARGVRADFPVDDAEADTARAALRRIDCLPLAVELLAARVAGPGWTTPARWPPDSVQWCYERVSPARRELLAALTVFDAGRDVGADPHAGIDTASCEAVAEVDGDTARVLAGLAAEGLLTPTGRSRSVGTGPPETYRVPGVIADVAARALHRSDAAGKVRQRHALWCADLLHEAADTVAEHGDLGAYERLRRAEGDLATAVRWATTAEPTLAAELTGRIGLLCAFRPRSLLLSSQVRVARDTDPRLSRNALAAASGAEAAVRCGLAEEGLRLAARAAELARTPQERCQSLHALACAYHDLGRDGPTVQVCRELLAYSEVDAVSTAEAHAFLALTSARGGAPEEALAEADQAHALASDAGSSARAALATYARGRALLAADLPEAASTLVAARSEAGTADAAWIAATAGTDLARVLLRLGRVPEAGKLLQRVLDDWQRMRAVTHLCSTVALALDCVTATGDRAAAAALRREWAEPDPGALADTGELRAARTGRRAARALATVFGTAEA